MEITALELAQLLQGTIEGDPSVSVSRPGIIESGQPGEICFLANNKQYEEHAYTTAASVLLVDKNFQPKQKIASTLIRVENVYNSLAFLLEKFNAAANGSTVHVISERASVHPSVKMGKNVAVGDFTIIEEGATIGDNCRIFGQVYVGKNVQIGDNCLIYAGVKIYHGCQIGARGIFHAGVVIGADGFGFAPQADGSNMKIPHSGNVVIEDDVEIGANSCVDRATIGSTFIRKGVKLDNLIQIGHNVEIGEYTVIAALAGVSGSTKIGQKCRIGGQVGVIGHIVVGDNVQVQAQTGIGNNMPSGSKLAGTPAIGFTEYLRSYAVFKKLPDLLKRIIDLEKKINV